MRQKLNLALAGILYLSGTVANAASPDGCSADALEMGRQVLSVGAAIRDPDTAGAMQTITELGTDSRHYTMVRGWLMMRLRGDESVVSTGAVGEHPEVEARISFFKQAIRAIDLE